MDSLPATVEPAWPPYPLGTSYFEVEVEAGDVIGLRLDAVPVVQWGLVAVDPAASSSAVATELQHTVAETGILTVGVVNLGPEDLDAEDVLYTATFSLEIAVGDGTGEPGTGGCSCGAAGVATAPLWLLLLLAAALRLRTASGRRR